MGWAIGYDTNWHRDIGYGVPAKCDHPDCDKDIHRGLAHVCGGEPYGGDEGCGLYFCEGHLVMGAGNYQACERCAEGKPPYEPKPDTDEWIHWKLTDESWQQWRKANPEAVDRMRKQMEAAR